MPGHDVIVIGASAGGIEASRELVAGLPADLAAAVFLVLHLAPGRPSSLPEILSRSGPLPAVHAEDGAPIAPGRIFVAPPGRHLVLEDEHMRVLSGPFHNRHRPAIDPLFRTAALSFGPRVIGVILTGALDDGTLGLMTIKRRGGVAVVQNPESALFSGMPASALASVAVDHVMEVAAIGPLLARLTTVPASALTPPQEPRLVEELKKWTGHSVDLEKIGRPSRFACPE